jgi:hypothetical protein
MPITCPFVYEAVLLVKMMNIGLDIFAGWWYSKTN